MSKSQNMFFIFVTILVLSIVQAFLLEFSLFKDLHIAFAQSTNATSILVPSNMNKTEITLKNEESVNPKSIFENPLLIALISGLTAILGGIMGSYMTNRSNRQMDEKRYARERKIEKEKQEQQEKQSEEYIEKVRVVIYLELLEASSNFKIMMNEEFWKTYPESGFVETFRHTVESAITSHEFTKLPFDLKLRLFTPDVLYSVQNTYSRIDYYYRTLLILLAQHANGSLKDFQIEVMNIASGSVTEHIDRVTEKLKKIIPKTIVDKFKVE